MSPEAADFVERYWTEYEASKLAGPPTSEDEDPVFPAWHQLDQYLKSDAASEAAFRFDRMQLLIFVARSAPDTAALEYLGVGAIEQHLRSQDAAVGRIEDAALDCEPLRQALRYAWFDGFLPPEVAERLRLVAPKPDA